MPVLDKNGMWDTRDLSRLSFLGAMIAKEMHTFGVIVAVPFIETAEKDCHRYFERAVTTMWARQHSEEFSSWLLNYLIARDF